MIVTVAYMGLVVAFVLVIVLHAWFVRRLANLRERARATHLQNAELRKEVAELADTVGELERGKDSNAASIQALEREIVELEDKSTTFLEEHPELRAEFGGKAPASTGKRASTDATDPALPSQNSAEAAQTSAAGAGRASAAESQDGGARPGPAAAGGAACPSASERQDEDEDADERTAGTA